MNDDDYIFVSSDDEQTMKIDLSKIQCDHLLKSEFMPQVSTIDNAIAYLP